jgi:uncharacterized membrane protein YdjX (TVP38/TMEM64 family)
MSTALACLPEPAAPSPTGPLLLRRFGSPEWDAALRATGMVGVLAIPVLLFLPRAEPMLGLVLATLWMRGPASAFIPAGLEPVLMLYGRLYPVWMVTLVAAGASAYAEVLSLHLVRGVMATRLLARARLSVQGSRVMRLFNRHPAAAIAITASSPIPDWITRTLAAVSGYPLWRYVLADTLGRLPKIWIPAALGTVIAIPNSWLVAISAGSIVCGGAVGIWKWWSMQRTPSRRARALALD